MNKIMETKHTKGEWKLSYPEINDPTAFIIGDIDGFILAYVYGAMGTSNDIEEAEANAKLIAAAPDLLEALTELVEWVKNGDYESSFLNKAEEAIKKATE